MSKPTIPANLNDTVEAQHLGIIHLTFGVDSMEEVDRKAEELLATGFLILSGADLRRDGYYEFETLDPDGNRLEVGTMWEKSSL